MKIFDHFFSTKSVGVLSRPAVSLLFSVCLFAGMQQVAFASEDKVEDFSFLDIDGNTHQFSNYSGKWSIVNYWATYCAPCLQEVPDLVEFTKTNRHRAVVLGFDAGGSEAEDLHTFSVEHNINYPIAAVQKETMNAFGAVTAIPTSYIVSPEGETIAKVIGVLDVHKIERLMDAYEAQNNMSEAAIEPMPETLAEVTVAH